MLIYDQHFPIGDNVILIFDIDRFCFQSILNMVDFSITHIFIDVLYLQNLLKLCNSFSRKLSCLGLFINVIISIFFLFLSILIIQNLLNKAFGNFFLSWTRSKQIHYLCIVAVFFSRFFSWLRDNKWSSRFINQNTINLIHNRKIKWSPSQTSFC